MEAAPAGRQWCSGQPPGLPSRALLSQPQTSVVRLLGTQRNTCLQVVPYSLPFLSPEKLPSSHLCFTPSANNYLVPSVCQSLAQVLGTQTPVLWELRIYLVLFGSIWFIHWLRCLRTMAFTKPVSFSLMENPSW